MDNDPYKASKKISSLGSMKEGSKKRRNEKGITALGNNIRKYRKLRGLTISQLANQMDVDYSQISRMELGTVNTNISMIFAVADVLEIKAAQLLEDDDTSWPFSLL
ncbi:helix-turn-helix domain-containing protein [Pedobacter hartonius]|nr:helix-turn-helix transcriptional regulator [Pedobacter hartonius]